MAITSAGFAGGPMTEADWAGIVGNVPPTFDSTSAYAVTGTTNGSARGISVAPGGATHWGVRAASDSNEVRVLTAPSSGGAWFLLTLRRTWSPTKATTVEVLAGPTTGTTTVPVLVPRDLPSTFTSVPGTQTDQPIAWVFVNSADVVATVFDLRLIQTQGGMPVALTFHGLAAAATFLQNGAEVQVQGTTMPATTPANGISLLSGVFRKVGGYLSLLDTLSTYNSVGDFATLTSILVGLTSHYPTRIVVGWGARVIDQGSKVDATQQWRYRGTSGGWSLVPNERMVLRAHDQAAQTIAHGGWSPIQFRTIDQDAYGMAKNGNATSFTCPWTGLYEISAKVAFQGDIPSTSRVILKWQGTDIEGDWIGDFGAPSDVPRLYRTIIQRPAGSLLSIQAFIDGATTTSRGVSFGSFATWPTLTVRFLGDAS